MRDQETSFQGQLFPGAETGQVLPFGKYKDQPIEVLLTDPDYARWLMDAMREKMRLQYPAVFQFIVARYGEPGRTPEHNRLQNLFLEREFQLKFAIAACPGVSEWVKLESADLNEEFRRWAEAQETRARTPKSRYESPESAASRLKETLRLRERYRNGLQIWVGTGKVHGDVIDHPVQITGLRFEEDGSDVCYTVAHRWAFCLVDADGFPLVDEQKLLYADESRVLAVQIKPVLGDDYPAVLRSMKAVRSGQLLVREYTGVGATWEQVKQVFALDNIVALRLEDVEKVAVPTAFNRARKPCFEAEKYAPVGS